MSLYGARRQRPGPDNVGRRRPASFMALAALPENADRERPGLLKRWRILSENR
jgi:hypothetical protein